MIYKSIFIDLDDTLWDTYHNNKECLEELYTDYHFNRYYASFEAFFDIYMPHNLDLWAKYRSGEIDRQTLILDRFLYVLRPLGIEDKKTVLSVNNDFLQRTTTKTRLVPGAIELLEYLRPSYRLFILSNGFREVQFKKLSNAGLAPYFEQEMIYYIEKLDVNEEKNRLDNHLKYFISTMESGHGQGKKLGFIAQEMGREINTLGSKSNHAEMQKIVVQMKDELEQIKEQVLNVL